jgi:hypothetical protein
MVLATGATLLDAHAVLIIHELDDDAFLNFLLAHDFFVIIFYDVVLTANHLHRWSLPLQV